MEYTQKDYHWMMKKEKIKKFGNIDDLELSVRTHRFLRKVLGCEHIKDVVDFLNNEGRFNMKYILYYITNSDIKFRGSNDPMWSELNNKLKDNYDLKGDFVWN